MVTKVSMVAKVTIILLPGLLSMTGSSGETYSYFLDLTFSRN